MKILILGAGQVGSSVAEALSNEDNDVTIVDTDASVLRDLREKIDIRTEAGMAAYPRVLERAGIEDADLLIAVTNSDEVNMIACQVAFTLYRTPTKIARIRSSHYLSHPRLFVQEALPIDVLISPEELVTQQLFALLKYPGTLQVIEFAEGKVIMAGVRALAGGALVGQSLDKLASHLPNVSVKIVAIFRKGKAQLPEPNTVLAAGDEVFFISTPQHVRTVTSALRKLEKPYKRIIIAGGGNIGNRLARMLETQKYNVKIIERDRERAAKLAERLDTTMVLDGDASDEVLLEEENIENTDAFISVTNDDEANILSSMLAKRLGARQVISLINRLSYADLVETNIDLVISPQLITISALMTHIRRGDIVGVKAIRRGAAEAIEVIAHGDEGSSRVIGRPIQDLKLPPACLIAAVVRENEIIMAEPDLTIQADDHIIMLLADKRYVPAVEKLFQVGIHFF